MDIALLATANSSIQTNDAVGIAVMKMAMNNIKQSGEDMSDMLKSSDPNLGNNIDVRV